LRFFSKLKVRFFLRIPFPPGVAPEFDPAFEATQVLVCRVGENRVERAVQGGGGWSASRRERALAVGVGIRACARL
jgi:hypothetical protein